MAGATPTEVDRCQRLEDQDETLTCLKLGITSYSAAQPTLAALKKSLHLKDLFITSSIANTEIGQLCRDILTPNRSLERLTLELAEVSDEGAQFLGELIEHSADNLKYLSLLLNNVTERGASQFARSLQRSNLLGFSIYGTQLDLHDLSIGDSGAAHFGAALRHCNHLHTLCIAQNSVTNKGLEALLDGLSDCKSVTSLDIHSNAIDSLGAARLAAFLVSNTTLKWLILDENHSIGDEGARELAIALTGHNHTLERLSLRSCGIGEDGGKRFATTLSRTKTLKELTLRGNVGMGDNAVEMISRGLAQNSSLQRLDLSSCGVGGVGCSCLADSLKENSSLTHLFLQGNEIGDGGAVAMSEALSKNSTLTKLVLTENRIGQRGVASLMSSLNQNSSVIRLAVDKHPLAVGGDSVMDTLLAKNKELTKCRRTIRELQRRNRELQTERDSLKKQLEECQVSSSQ